VVAWFPAKPRSSDVVADGDDQPLSEGGKRDEQADGADDAGVHRRLGQPAQEQAVEEETEQRGEDECCDDQRRHGRHAGPGVELVEEVGRREGDGPVGEVEDPGRRVGEHETGRHDRVDRAGDRP